MYERCMENPEKRDRYKALYERVGRAHGDEAKEIYLQVYDALLEGKADEETQLKAAITIHLQMKRLAEFVLLEETLEKQGIIVVRTEAKTEAEAGVFVTTHQEGSSLKN